MAESQHRLGRRLGLLLGAGIACGAIAWHVGPRSLTLANEWIGVAPIGEIYSHQPDDFPQSTLGDVPPQLVEPRSLGDDRVRQFDELDRPRFAQRLTHRGAQLNSERFTVVATRGEADASLALAEFTRAWNEFSTLADTFTGAHRNPDFGIGQLLIVVDDQPTDQRSEPVRPLQLQDGQTIVYINIAEGQPSLEEQLPTLRQGAVHALLHLAELDRKFPTWVQQGLAEYTALKIEQADNAQLDAERVEDEQGFDPDAVAMDAVDGNEDALTEDEQEDSFASERPQYAKATPIGTEYWRLQRALPDRLADESGQYQGNDDMNDTPGQRVTFLLEGDDAAHAPGFLLGLRELAEEATDPVLSSRAHVARHQLLPPVQDSMVDEAFEELNEDFVAWQKDPLRGQPLFLPGGDIPDPAMLAREKEMEVVLKLALRVQNTTSESDLRPRVTEFGADGLRETMVTPILGQAIDVERLYYELVDTDTPWATRDADGSLLLWTEEERLAEILGVQENRYTSEFRDGKWVLVTAWDEGTQLEAWLEPNDDNPSRPLLKFAAQPRINNARIAELDVSGVRR